MAKLAIVLAALLMGACSTMQDMAHGKFDLGLTKTTAGNDQAREDADRKFAAFDYQGAAAGYKAILDKNPDDSGARLGLAESQLGGRRLDDARANFVTLSKTAGYEARGSMGVGMVELRKGNLDPAIAWLKAAVSRDATLWRAWNALAQAQDLSKNWAASADAYAQALKYAQDPALVHNNIGVSLLAQGKYDDALKEFDIVLKAHPEMATARTNRQLTLAMMKRYPDAVAGLSSDDKARALNNVGYIAMLKGDYDNAEKFFQQAMQESPNNKLVRENLDLVQRLKPKTEAPAGAGD